MRAVSSSTQDITLSLSPKYMKHFFNRPHMIRNSCFHRGSHAQGLVDAAEVIVHVVNCQRMCVILDFLAESICQPSEAPHGHAHREILPFDKAGRNVFGIGMARYDHFMASDALCR